MGRRAGGRPRGGGGRGGLEEAREDLDSWLADTKLRGILRPDRYADATTDRVAVVEIELR